MVDLALSSISGSWTKKNLEDHQSKVSIGLSGCTTKVLVVISTGKVSVGSVGSIDKMKIYLICLSGNVLNQ